MLGKRWNFKIVSLTGPAVNKVQDELAWALPQVEASPLLALHQTPPAGRGRCIGALASRQSLAWAMKGLARGLTRQLLSRRIPQYPVALPPMARISISLTDEILEQLKETKPSHRPMSQHIADLLVESMSARRAELGEKFSERVAKIAAREAWKKSPTVYDEKR